MSNVPEIGQILFGQPWKEFECPEWVIAFLDRIRRELDRVMWNINQEEYASPFDNTGNQFKNEVFEVCAYSWNTDQVQSYNFKWKDVEISWYKHSWRGTTINQELEPTKGIEMLNECIASIEVMDRE